MLKQIFFFLAISSTRLQVNHCLAIYKKYAEQLCAGPYGPNWSNRWSSMLLPDPLWWPLEDEPQFILVKPYIQVYPPKL